VTDNQPAARTLGALLAELDRRHPTSAAVHYEGEVLTYGELHAATRAVARGLLSLNVRHGDRVAVLFGNQPEWLVATLGAATIGAVVVPLNTWYKERELEWTICHCGVSVIISIDRFLKQDYSSVFTRVSSPDLKTVVFAGRPAPGTMWWDDLHEPSTPNRDRELEAAAAAVRPEDAAFILYTSGSTAEPKGVVLNHGGVIANGFGIGERRSISAEDRIWLGAPLFYGLGATNALPVALTHGASLVVHDHFDAGTAIDAIARTGATVYYGTGNMTQAILEHPTFSPSKVGTLSKGNAGTMTEYKRLTLTELRVTEATPAYGLTESYGHATGGWPDDPLEVKLHTDGEPLPGVELRIVDNVSGEELGRGQSGRVLLRGPVTPGYYANPEETSKAIGADGWFDTGDYGHLDAGRFVFEARLKEVIKSGGINVSPLEVEQLMVTHPSVRDAFVVGVADPVNGEQLVAFVNARTPVAGDELRDFLRERSASFKVPRHFLFRSEDQLPRLASGKVAKHALIEEARRELIPPSSGR
jgi:fatty-acyl-CoA synthase